MTPFIVPVLASAAIAQIQFDDATEAVGLAGLTATRVVLVDLDGDTRPDVVVDRARVFMNRAVERAEGESGPLFGYVEVARTGLPQVNGGDCLVFADLDNDGKHDAIVTRNVTGDTDPVLPTAWYPGNGDGTFGGAVVISEAAPKTTACVAVGDVNADGLLDIYLGNWYTAYGEGYEAFTNDLLLQNPDGTFRRQPTDEDEHPFSEDEDKGGRPTYGAMIARLAGGPQEDGYAQILELSYGRRADRLWSASGGPGQPMRDIAPMLGLDADPIRHGRYPEWLRERAKTDARFADFTDEQPFRSNGNGFDAAVNDVDGDGRFDVLLTTIAHAWAGESSDRSRLMLQREPAEGEALGAFVASTGLNLDRMPADPAVHNWNQGDLFGALADFDLDGRVDVMLSSGDYPDNQRLRVWRHMAEGSFVDETSWSGLDNDGSQQISLGDIDLDGDVDVLVGQSFNRMPVVQRAGRTPTLKVYLNRAADKGTGHGLVLVLEGDPEAGVSRDALGVIVRVDADTDGDGAPEAMLRQMVGIGGHAGKQHAFEAAFGLGQAARAQRVTVWWPGAAEPTVIEGLDAGRHVIRIGE